MAGAIDEVLVSTGPGETRLALIENGRVVEFVIDRGDGWPGDIARGRVVEINRGARTVFIDIGSGRPGVLATGRASLSRFREGEALLVQIKAAAYGEKGAELSDSPSLPGRLLVFTPLRPGLSVSRRLPEIDRTRLKTLLSQATREGEGVVLRTEAGNALEEELLAELETQRTRWHDLQGRFASASGPGFLRMRTGLERVCAESDVRRVLVEEPAALVKARAIFPDAELWREAPLFDRHEAAWELERSLLPVVPLDGGASLLFGTAAGVSIIDIDGGPREPTEANKESVGEIARQLRLRALGGHILVDAIPSRQPNALTEMVSALRRAVAGDPTPTHVVGTTPLGMIEMTRQRRGPSLAESLLCVSLPGRNAATLALEGLRALVAENRARPGASLTLTVGREVMTELRRRSAALSEAEERLGRAPRLIEEDGIEGYEIREEP